MVFRCGVLISAALSVLFVNTHVSHAQAPVAQAPPLAEAPPQQKPKLVKKKIGDIRQLHVFGDIYLAGQPSREDMTLLKEVGIKTVITLRKPAEVPWDEGQVAKQLDMKFVAAPFGKPDELQDKLFDDVLRVLRDKKRGPTLLHCGSANRVGAFWYAHRVLDDKLSHEDALKEAKTVGLRTPEYLDRAQAYVKKVSEQPTVSPEVPQQ